MTTPAISYSVFGDPVTEVPYSSDCTGNIYPYSNDFMTSWRLEERPASATSLKDNSGWRNPTNWTHYKFDSIFRPDGYNESIDYFSCGPGVVRVEHNTGVVDHSDSVSHAINTALTGDDDLREQAAVKAYLKLKSSDVNLAVAFAERRETAELFESVVKRVASQVRSFKGRRFKDFLKAAASEGTSNWRQTPNAWLEMQYGWKPLMADVQGACQSISKRENNSSAFRASVKGHSHRSIENTYSSGGPGGLNQYLTTKVGIDYTVRLHYVLDSPLIASFASLGLTNPAEVIWERLGYSFVVDWFLPVGNWLSALDADFGWKFLIGSGTQFARVKSSARNVDGADDPNVYQSNHYHDARVDGFAFLRQVFGEPPGIGLPHFKNPLSGVHVANAMSLLTSAFRR